MIDVNSYLSDISWELPSGENLEYDPLFGELERAAQPKADQQFGSTVIEGQEPEWKEVRRLALDLLTRARDMRLVAYLSRASLGLGDFREFCQTIELMTRLVQSYWASIHPQLDPDDDNDPTFRMNVISSYCDQSAILRGLNRVAIVRSLKVGKFSHRDVQIAAGDIDPPKGMDKPPEMSLIEAAFTDVEIDDISADLEAARGSLANVQSLDSYVTSQVGSSNAVSMTPLLKELKDIVGILEKQLLRRTPAASPSADATELSDAPSSSGEIRMAMRPVGELTGAISSRDDVLKAFDLILEYYRVLEPSSPVPILITRAKRLATSTFLDIIKDIEPDLLPRIRSLEGHRAASGGSDSPAGIGNESAPQATQESTSTGW